MGSPIQQNRYDTNTDAAAAAIVVSQATLAAQTQMSAGTNNLSVNTNSAAHMGGTQTNDVLNLVQNVVNTNVPKYIPAQASGSADSQQIPWFSENFWGMTNGSYAPNTYFNSSTPGFVFDAIYSTNTVTNGVINLYASGGTVCILLTNSLPISSTNYEGWTVIFRFSFIGQLSATDMFSVCGFVTNGALAEMGSQIMPQHRNSSYTGGINSAGMSVISDYSYQQYLWDIQLPWSYPGEDYEAATQLHSNGYSLYVRGGGLSKNGYAIESSRWLEVERLTNFVNGFPAHSVFATFGGQNGNASSQFVLKQMAVYTNYNFGNESKLIRWVPYGTGQAHVSSHIKLPDGSFVFTWQESSSGDEGTNVIVYARTMLPNGTLGNSIIIANPAPSYSTNFGSGCLSWVNGQLIDQYTWSTNGYTNAFNSYVPLSVGAGGTLTAGTVSTFNLTAPPVSYETRNSILTTRLGTLLLPFLNRINGSNGVFRSTDNGVSWSTVYANVGDEAALVNEFDGAIGMFGRASPTDYCRSTNDGVNWSAAVSLTNVFDYDSCPSAFSLPDGNVVLCGNYDFAINQRTNISLYVFGTNGNFIRRIQMLIQPGGSSALNYAQSYPYATFDRGFVDISWANKQWNVQKQGAVWFVRLPYDQSWQNQQNELENRLQKISSGIYPNDSIGSTTNVQFTDTALVNPTTNTLYFINGKLMNVTSP